MTEAYPKAYLYKRIVRAKLFIDDNYFEAIDVDDIADEACFSKFHFIRTFKRIYGKTPHQYLIGVRIEKAMRLLQENVPVTAVCLSVGFESLGSFSVLFKRVVGMSPSAWLLQRQQIKEQMSRSPLAFIPGCHAEKNGWLKKSNFEEARDFVS